VSVPLLLIAATGNRFALLDAFAGPPPVDPGALAMRLGEQDELAVDGLLQLLPPSEGGDCRMVVHNVDGSRPEACGNGLRCIARAAIEAGHVVGPVVRVETDAGLRAVEILSRGADVTLARASLGRPQIVDLSVRLDVHEGVVEAAVVKLGNPHCVLFVPDTTTAPVRSVGRQLEHHSRFPDRVNVEFVDARRDGLVVRVWERGVGETRSCGTGVSAAAVAAIVLGRATSPVRVRTAGGSLVVRWDGEGHEVLLEGEVSAPERSLDPALLS